jgi:predicted neuraminidase
MLVELRDGSLWMLIRNTRGIAQAISRDNGRSWDKIGLYLDGRKHASKRFFIRRLRSGGLLFVRNDAPDGGRSHLTAFVSDDDGTTWKGGLVIDERESSYPDGVQAADGTIYIIYDQQRYTLNREGNKGVGSVVMAKFHEEDIRAGRIVNAQSRLRSVVSQLRDTP